MNKIIYVLLIIFCFSCEDQIDVELNNAAPRLVIDASINWVKGTTGNQQRIKLSLSAPYFDTNVPPANNAIVEITDSSNNVFIFTENNDTGIYQNSTFIPIIDEIYTLNIIYDGEVYTANETLMSVSPIEYVEQINDGGFSGEETELKAFYTDPEEEENYYFFEFASNVNAIPSLEVYEDRFTNGNQVFGFYSDENLEAGDVVVIRNHGVSKQFYEFMFILLQQNSEGGGGPFETQPATVRGNCINTTNSDNFPFGYFRLSEVDEFVYTIE